MPAIRYLLIASISLLHHVQPGADLWVDPAWSDPVDAGEVPRVTLWFEPQLLGGGDAYARATVEHANARRLELRGEIVRRLKALNAESMRRARPALDALAADGVVAGCRAHWIVNSVTCDLPRADPARLREVPGASHAFRAFGRPSTPPPAAGAAVTRTCAADDAWSPDSARAPWNARMLNVHRVWGELKISGRGVKHVVHDFGWTLASPPVQRTLWCNPREIAGNRIDDDGNGFVDDVHGFNFDRGDAVLAGGGGGPGDAIGMTHGDLTAASLAGRDMTDSAYVVGIAPGGRWAAVLSSQSIEPGVEWAIEQGFDTYSMSFSLAGLGHLRSHWRRVMEHGALAGIFFVTGAGNFANPDAPNYVAPPIQMRVPEDIPLAVFGVTGVARDGRRPAFASQGPVMWRTVGYDEGEVAKPDVATINANLTLVDSAGRANHRGVNGWSGNSFAGPHLGGVIGLMLEADPSLTPWRAREILVRTARDIESPGVDHQVGHGLVDAFAAVREVAGGRR